MLKPLIYRLGANPKRSLKVFLIGLLLFAVGAGAIVYGYFHEAYWQLLGLILLVPAIGLAAIGYLGIFANRFAQVMKRVPPRRANDA
ncbi:hypothetical protein [Algicola sagamiensis]|uniref:hypothetical protein n=1 Tax=Algicola sagamiensis TaxID=163869 RepID=UPI00035F5780|nr:hypothetical protein [Algicola sagamiensis]